MKATCSVLLLIVCVSIPLSGCNTTNQTVEQVPQVIAANEMAAQARLRSIANAEAQYQIDSGGSFAMLDVLVDKHLLGDPSHGKLTGYKFEVTVSDGGFEATAVPVKFGVTGRRSFLIDQSNVVRAADKGGAPATASDPAL
jgi:hypothetical protein